MTIESNRTLGGLGAILTLLGAISTALSLVRYTGGSAAVGLVDLGILGVSSIISILAFVGFILFMVAMHGFSRDYGEHRIFSYLLYGFIAAIVMSIIIVAIWFVLIMANVFTLIGSLNPSGLTDSTQIQSLIAPYFASLMVAVSLAMVVWVVANYKSLNLLANKSEVQHFRVAAKFFLLGAVVSVVVAATLTVMGYFSGLDYSTMLMVSLPGGVMQYIGWVFAAKGFFSIKASPQKAPEPPYSTMVNQAGRYCMHCGAQNQGEFTYCIRCGQKLQ